MSRATRWLGSVLLAATFAGCATAPPPVRVPGEAAAWLGGAPRVLVRLDAAQVSAWGEVTKSREALRDVGRRTAAVWLGFDLEHLDDLRTAADTMRIVLEGDFPRGGAGLMLDWNPAWKKGPARGVWTNPKLGLSVTLPEEGLVTVRRHDPALVTRAGGVLRDLNPVTVEGSAVWLSFWDPGRALFGETGARLLPVERLDVRLAARGGLLEGPLVLRFSDPRAARAAAVLLKLFSAQVRARLGQDLDWNVDGSQIVGQTLRLKQDDLGALAEKLINDPPTEVATP